MKSRGYGKAYQYDHDVEGGVALGQTGVPDAMGEEVYYEPTTRGMEARIGEKLAHLRALDEAAGGKAGGAGRSARVDDQS